MKIVCTYQMEVTFEDNDLTKEELLAMTDDERYSYAYNIRGSQMTKDEKCEIINATFIEGEKEIVNV